MREAAELHGMSRECCCQAEDGIRDAQESGGLGDGYKRQVRKEEVIGGSDRRQ